MTKNIYKLVTSFFIVSVVTLCVLSEAFATSKAKISLKVIDEEGKVVVGARVGIGFTEYLA